ncbi:hypothetical protein AGMMS49959_07220 [Planctomycetales bacterium]|nr:hypothetical protein AGMMS49959_07220 [Planctomycetales bacterium]
MPLVKVYLHFVWSTKGRYPYLNTPDLRMRMWQHIKEHAGENQIFIDRINGYAEHCHCLISLGISQTIQKTVQILKGESSCWANRQKLCEENFAWQDGYFASSVSASMLERVRIYIENQESHHTHKSFQQEYDEFLARYGFEAIAGKVSAKAGGFNPPLTPR